MSERWEGLDVRQLVALHTVAAEGSFKVAADVLGYTPPAVSQQIASLERIVGTEIVVREPGRQMLGLTEAGRILLRHVSAVEAHLSAARSEIEAYARGAV